MMYNFIKISGPSEALLDFNDLLRVQQLKNDNVQGFDTKWDEALLSMTKVPDEKQKQLRSSEQLKTLAALYMQDTAILD